MLTEQDNNISESLKLEDPKNIEVFLNQLEVAPNVTSLTINKVPNLFSNETLFKRLCDILQKNHTITHLNLSSNNMHGEDVEKLTNALIKRFPSPLLNLDLSHNRICKGRKKENRDPQLNRCPNAMIILGKTIGVDSVFSSLNLSDNELEATDITHLREAINKSCNLNHILDTLDLSNNGIDSMTAFLLIESIIQKTHCKNLILSNNIISNPKSDSKFGRIVNLLKQDYQLSLEVVDLSNNPVKPDSKITDDLQNCAVKAIVLTNTDNQPVIIYPKPKPKAPTQSAQAKISKPYVVTEQDIETIMPFVKKVITQAKENKVIHNKPHSYSMEFLERNLARSVLENTQLGKKDFFIKKLKEMGAENYKFDDKNPKEKTFFESCVNTVSQNFEKLEYKSIGKQIGFFIWQCFMSIFVDRGYWQGVVNMKNSEVDATAKSFQDKVIKPRNELVRNL